MTAVGRLGERAISRLRRFCVLAAVIWSVLLMAVRPRFWTRPVRSVLARQILFTGIEATSFMTLASCMVGIAVVVQVQFWLMEAGQSELLGPLLAAIVIREVAPLLANFIVIGRSGSAISTELGNMKVEGEVRILDAQGLDPFVYLVVPRVLGVAASVFCLGVLFVVVSLTVGFLCGFLAGGNTGIPSVFIESMIRAIQPGDVINFLVKTVLSGLLTGAICCVEGLSVGAAITEVPQATTRALVRSVGALLIVSAVVSVFTYL